MPEELVVFRQPKTSEWCARYRTAPNMPDRVVRTGYCGPYINQALFKLALLTFEEPPPEKPCAA